MKKLTTILLSLATLSTFVWASEDATQATTTSSAEKEKSGEGFYIGGGLGASFYSIAATEGTYFLGNDTNDPAYSIKGDDLSELDDSDVGYTLYAGYQFNKIIGVEGAYTDYGSFSGTLKGVTYQKDPQSLAVYANAGYSFFDGQLRPFGLLGLGYINSKQSRAYEIQNITESSVTLHAGLGVEYYPTVLKGLGLRATWSSDSFVDTDYETFDSANIVQSESIWQYYSLLYLGVQYKF